VVRGGRLAYPFLAASDVEYWLWSEALCMITFHKAVSGVVCALLVGAYIAAGPFVLVQREMEFVPF
jgi:hypothetical protein